MKDNEKLIEDARRDIGDADRCQALHITPATGTILRRLREVTNALEAAEKAHTPTDDKRESLGKAIWRAVLQECQGQFGGEPHATTWARGGYRNDVPVLCERCKRLIATLQNLDALRGATPSETQGGRCDHPEQDCANCGHQGDCATHNEPAMPAGPCDCKPQGEPDAEPSDAQVEAAWAVLERDGLTVLERGHVRAALRAAGGVR
ncbi:hypothetical protein HOT29_gp013 [Microbacterium phage Squash]|uniref:Uncharacterized protein n=1 Tax=Microbacterium phage Squash TaxID=2182357 RepID=A0A2U8ULY3_9CAUD|nr:hypothetical protein HOT29_gp013 [Microbacterium phage Squash]AWN04632.1 hypothetical protein PBI_SQUASH_13 [Microbacterium phage Squash]QIQ63597.1 hypothetical protein SEA_NIKE_12 [Microbacterium phage Nike]